MRNFRIRVPASSANIGPGYDILGLALSLWLEIRVNILDSDELTNSRCLISREGEGCEKIPCDPESNMITKTALNVLREHNVPDFPTQIGIHIVNEIPLGRGLGSSASATVAGCLLANAVADLKLSKEQMLSFCVEEENHPDNLAASIFGGFVGSYLVDRSPGSSQQVARSFKIPWSQDIKVLVIIPDYEVKTESARKVLPRSYAKEDGIFNAGRVLALTQLLGQSPPDAIMIHEAMQDRLHQMQRKDLVHGLENLLKLTPESTPGLLGLCLSGAGPCILALATENLDAISEKIIRIIKDSDENIQCSAKQLDPALEGATIDCEST